MDTTSESETRPPEEQPTPEVLPPPGLTAYVRPLIAFALTGLVSYLALMGNQEAITAIIAAFSVLLGALWGERSALKRPGVDS